MKTSWYNRDRKFKNGVVWVRLTSGPLRHWGLWVVDRRAEQYDTGDNSSPWSPALMVRLPRFSVAILHPDGR